MSPAALVAQFHRHFGMPHRTSPIEGLPDAEVNLWVALLEEEVREVVSAAWARDLPEVAHEFADVVYVAYATGAGLRRGPGRCSGQGAPRQHDQAAPPVHHDEPPGPQQAWKPVKGPGYTPPEIGAVLGIQVSINRRRQGSEG